MKTFYVALVLGIAALWGIACLGEWWMRTKMGAS